MQEYDPQTNKWAEKSPLEIGRRDFMTQVIRNGIYAIGGVVGPDSPGVGTAMVEEYTAVKLGLNKKVKKIAHQI